ncbi:hypothetical protein [Acidocella sp.]|uniref:hypothetical protein n=1 Tax=Acidocella sp. TaxID=50710 RepID=UPI0026260CA7|nr:hypothetical protein [Acidocella sp.]
MRELNRAECETASGGAGTTIKFINGPIPPGTPANGLTGIQVTAPYEPEFPTSGQINYSGTGTAGPSTGGGPGETTPLIRDLPDALLALAKELSLAKFGIDITGPLAQAADAGKVSETTMDTTIQDLKNDYNAWTNSSGNCACDPSAQGSFIPWQDLNWLEVDPGANLSLGQVLQVIMQDTANGTNVWNKQ